MKYIKSFVILLTTLFIIMTGFIYYIYHSFTSSSINENTYFIVNKGDYFPVIVDNLTKQKLVNHKFKKIFLYSAKLLNKNNLNIQAGEYLFEKDASLFDILQTLKNNKINYRKLTFAEGLSNDTILKIIDSTYGLTGDMPTESIKEGTLLPETYLYTYGDSKKDMIQRMQQAMTDFVNQEWEKRAKDLPFKTKEELLSLASIIEKETGIPDERYKVASVFVNRLKKGMKLQSDPTVVYAFTKGNKDLEREIRQSDLTRVSEYNTYIINGIPKLPIANPGKDAIRATLNPAKTDYLYFVATGTGGHNFSKTLEEHNNYVKEYRKIISQTKKK